MSSTNKTTNLELSQFLGSDSPKWLTDYNADMEKIDAGYQTVKAQADATDLVVGGHTSSISTLQDTVTSQGTAITGLRTDVNGNSGSINTINSLIGNGEPTTTDKTIIGAINEVNAKVGLIGPVPFVLASVTADGVKTYTALFNELFTVAVSTLSNLPGDAIVSNVFLESSKGLLHAVSPFFTKTNTAVGQTFDFNCMKLDSNGYYMIMVNTDGGFAKVNVHSDGTTQNIYNGDVPSDGTVIYIQGLLFNRAS